MYSRLGTYTESGFTTLIKARVRAETRHSVEAS